MLKTTFRFTMTCCSLLWGALFTAPAPVFAGEVERQPRGTIHPSIVTLEPGAEQWFKIIRGATRLDSAQWIEEVEWSVNFIPGGNDEVGRIASDGTYTAPAVVPVPREVNICARAKGISNPLLFATVLFEAERHTYGGLRLPWPIAGDRAWRRVHRGSGVASALAGLGLAGLAWTDPGPGLIVLAMALVLAALPLLAGLLTLALDRRSQ